MGSTGPLGSYQLTRTVVVRALALVYLCPFLSALWMDQHVALAAPGSGLVPARLLHELPNPIAWLGMELSPWTMRAAPVAGMLAALVVFSLPRLWPLFAVMWAAQLSLVNTSAPWIRSYGWEWQLLETTLPVVALCVTRTPSRVALVLLRWLAFRVMLGAGLSKLGERASSCWRELTCTTAHYLTQPLPNPLSLYFHQLPLAWHQAEVIVNHVVEVACPVLLLLPLRFPRIVAATLSIAYMCALGATGNYAFIQVVTVVPLLGCLDDDAFAWLARPFARPTVARVHERQEAQWTTLDWVRWLLVVALALFIASKSVAPVRELASSSPWLQTYDPYYWVNAYGVFGFVNMRRFVTVLSFSNGTHWAPLDLPCLPGSVDRAPCVIAPLLHPRLDWTTWIYTTASLEHPSSHARFVPAFLESSIVRLLRGDATIERLFATPLAGSARGVRAELYEYSFPTLHEHWTQGIWWKRIRVAAVPAREWKS